MVDFKGGLSICIVFIIISTPFIGTVSGDGGIFGKSDEYFYIDEKSQYAIINHENGMQKMLITVNFDWIESDNTAWIFPVPSNSEDVEIDIADGAPGFGGDDIIKDAKDDLKRASETLFVPYLSSTVIPLGPLLLFSISGMMTGSTGVDISKSLEKYGLIAEVISAKTGIGVYQYLKNNGLDIYEGAIQQFDNYVQKDYSFVVVWISDKDKLSLSPGILIEFPTKESFYPLVLTSIYGFNIIPLKLMVIGYVSPKIYKDIEPYCHIRYWYNAVIRGGGYSSSSEAENFTSAIARNWDNTFTSIEINAPSSFFTEDLWIENEAPDKVKYAEGIRENFHKGSAFFLLYLIFSLLIGFILGIILFGRQVHNIPFYLIMGGGNLIGIIGLIVFSIIFMKISNKKRDEDNKILLKTLGIFILAFIIFFIGLMWSVLAILLLPLS